MKKLFLFKGAGKSCRQLEDFTLIDDDLFNELNKYKWRLVHGYAERREYLSDGKDGFKTIYLHRLVNKTPYGYETDHVNGNRLDNRKENLRSVTSSQNKMNHRNRKDNKSGFPGVWYDRNRDKWVAELMKDGKKVFMKRFDSQEQAKAARITIEEVYFRDYRYIR